MLCGVCQNKAETACASCKCVYYCSRDCQKLDWKIHKKFCGSFVIKEEEEEKDGLKFTRRSIVAEKDLKRGDYILEESPLFKVSQLPCTLYNPEVSKEHQHECSTCGDKNSIKKCDRCKWPICVKPERNCGKLTNHAENECEILAAKKINYDSLEASEDRRVLLIARAQAMKEKKPEVWNELMKRAEEFSKAGQDSVHSQEEISELDNTMKKLKISKEDVKMYKKFFHLLNLTAIFYSSYQEIDCYMGIQQARVGDFLYPLSNYFSKSCAPNCNYAVDGHPNFKIQIRAARDIQKGEELTIGIDYLLVPAYEGTIERRKIIKGRLGYLCKCKRCSDPTEFGTFFSGIVCQSCRPQGENKNQLEENDGYFLPFDPEPKPKEEKDYSPLFQCNGCKTIRPYSFFVELLARIGKESKGKNEDFHIQTIRNIQKVLREFARIKLFVSKYSGKILHPNHFIIFSVHGLFFAHFHTDPFKNSEEKNKFEEICEDLVRVSKTQEELNNKLLDGSLMFNQIRMQDMTARALSRLAIGLIISDKSMCNEAQLIDAKEKVKKSIQLLEGAIHFHTKQMPTFFKRKLEFASNITELEEYKKLLQNMDTMYHAASNFKKHNKRPF